MARSDVLPNGTQLGLTLDKYQELMGIPVAAFNGLNDPGDPVSFQCTAIWKQRDRDNLIRFIRMTEEMRENEVNHFLSKKYVEDQIFDWGFPLMLNKGHLIEIGYKHISIIESEYELDYTADADIVTIDTTTDVTDTDEIKVFYQDEDVEIHPDSVVLDGGELTIVIQRARLVDPDLNDNREDPLEYATDANYVDYVDIKRVYYTEEDAATLIWLNATTGNEMTQVARPIVEDQALGIIELIPATYSGGWALSNYAYCPTPRRVRISFISGVVSERSNILTARMCHTLMPFKPQDCESVTQYWNKDNELHPSKVTTPYGTAYGAVEAWVFDSRFKSGGGGMFA